MLDDVSELKSLGSGKTEYTGVVNPEVLETFPNKHPDKSYKVKLVCPEFTSVCPVTGQPDFGVITIEYIPDELCLESKSLKLYLFSFRNTGMFMETIVNEIVKDLTAVCAPKWIKVHGAFNPRGGISIFVSAGSFECQTCPKKE